MERITLVKKILADGSPCAKCVDVLDRLERDGVAARIDRIVVADERDPASEGMRLAERHAVDRAPFFVVEAAGEPARVYTVYLRFVRDVLRGQTDEQAEAVEIARTMPALDYI